MKKITILSIFTFCTFISFVANSQTWTPLVSGTTNYLNGVAAPNANVCYVSGDAGTIKKTIDGGATWVSQVSGTSNGIWSLYFVSVDTGYAVGDGGIALKTVNGGANWTALTTGSSEAFRCVVFTNSSIGYITGGSSSGVILKTTNGGVTWTSTTIPTSVLYGTDFPTLTDGYTVDYNGLVAKTTNAGSTWSTGTTGATEILADVAFINSTTGFVVGRNGTIRKTTDSGASWAPVTSGTTSALSAITFVSSTNGFIVGGPIPGLTGTILSTVDAGVTWSSYTPGTSILYKMSFPDINTGYIVGNNGTILKYTNNVGIAEEPEQTHIINAFPNPAAGSASIDLTVLNLKEKVCIEMYDLAGKLIRRSEAPSTGLFIMNQDELTSGVYLFNVLKEKKIVGTGKIIFN